MVGGVSLTVVDVGVVAASLTATLGELRAGSRGRQGPQRVRECLHTVKCEQRGGWRWWASMPQLEQSRALPATATLPPPPGL